MDTHPARAETTAHAVAVHVAQAREGPHTWCAPVSTALITPCFLEGRDKFGNDRLVRNLRYLEYYRGIRRELGWHKVFLLDNASPSGLVEQLGTKELYLEMVTPDYMTGWLRSKDPGADLTVVRFNDRLVHDGTDYGYPYCWRALYYVNELIRQGYRKILHIDSDAFVLSARMVEFIRTTNTGWYSFWCPRWRFPEAAIHVINEDAFDRFREYTDTPWCDRVGRRMETDLPFTAVHHDFVGDRYGEMGAPRPADWMDFYCQAPTWFTMAYRGPE